MAAIDLTDEQLRAIYAWIDAVPLSRPKKNIARDFSDGILLAEVIAAYFPALVDLHNYPPANSVKQKVYNFETLNQRVLKKISYNIPRNVIEDVVNCKPGAIESVLNAVQFRMAKYRERKAAQAAGRAVTPTSDPSPERPRAVHHDAPRVVHKAAASHISPKPAGVMAAVDEEILLEKEKQIRELQETVEILELKIAKLEQLVRLKDNKIQKLLNKETPN